MQQLEVTCETKSKDNVFVHLVVSVQYQVVREAMCAPPPLFFRPDPITAEAYSGVAADS